MNVQRKKVHVIFVEVDYAARRARKKKDAVDLLVAKTATFVYLKVIK